jgi:hypothetical protein
MILEGKIESVPSERDPRSRDRLDFDFTDIAGYEAGASTTAYSSPAIPTVFDLNGAAGPASNMGTVSPQDLLIKEPFMSAPNSTALTNLTSPSIYNESPEFNDAFDVSPHFGSSDFDSAGGGSAAWFPLFPDADVAVGGGGGGQPSHAVPEADGSPEEEKSDEIDAAPQRPASGHMRRKSGSSPPSGRHSSVSGVNSRRRDKPLPPIIVEDASDTVAMKRARNTLAARKSRERKAMRLEELEERIQKLEAERDHWKKIALARGQ